MKLKKKIKLGICAAMRCKDPADESGFCPKHRAEAEAESADAPVPVPEAPIERFDADKAEAEAVFRELESLTIATDADMEFANEILAQIKDKAKAVKADRDSIAKPLIAAKKALDAKVKPVLDAYDRAERIIKAKIAEALAKTRAEQDRALTAVEQTTAEGAPLAGEVLAVAHGAGLVDQPANISVRDSWDVEIVDPDAVPRKFCSPDEPRIRAFVKATEGKEAVPGVRIIPKAVVSQRSGG